MVDMIDGPYGYFTCDGTDFSCTALQTWEGIGGIRSNGVDDGGGILCRLMKWCQKVIRTTHCGWRSPNDRGRYRIHKVKVSGLWVCRSGLTTSLRGSVCRACRRTCLQVTGGTLLLGHDMWDTRKKDSMEEPGRHRSVVHRWQGTFNSFP